MSDILWHKAQLTVLKLLRINEAITITVRLVHHALQLLLCELDADRGERRFELRCINGAVAVRIHLLEDLGAP